MDFLNKIVVAEIEHVLITDFKTREKTTMAIRPWYGIAFSLGGELTYIHNSKKILLSENNLVLLPKGVSYEVNCTKSGKFAIINFLTVNPLDFEDFISIEVKNKETFEKDFSFMHKLALSNQNNYEIMSLFYKILSRLINCNDQKNYPESLNNAIKYIEKNIDCIELCNSDIAKKVGISEVYLRKLFKNNLNTTANQYIQNKRVEKAKILLTETSMTITAISEKCGYSCVYYFCYAFKKVTGFTPTQYRNNYARNFL